MNLVVYLQDNITTLPQLSWEDVSRQVENKGLSTKCPSFSPENCQSMTHTLHHLSVATDYEAVVRVKNKHGWSPDSNIFLFSTRRG